MSSERQMRQRVIRILRPLHAVSVENAVGPGTPDVSYAEGWLECKSLKAWPRKPDTPLRCKHFTPQQRSWLRRRCRAGGRAHVLLKVADDWLLLDGKIAAEILGHATQEQLRDMAQHVWEEGLEEDELRATLSTSSPPTPPCTSRDTGRQATSKQ